MLARILTAVGRLIAGLAALPFDILQSLMGGTAPALPPAAAHEEMADRHADSLRDELRAPVRIMPPAVRTLGGHVHAYAKAADRAAFDLSLVPEEVAIALLGLDERRLAVLAVAGPEACGRWAAGQRSGIVGLPPVGSTTPPAALERRTEPAAASEPPTCTPFLVAA